MADPLPLRAMGGGEAARQLRSAGRDWLSLALIDARNHTLRLMAAWEEMLDAAPLAPLADGEGVPPLWLCGRIGWCQEAWIGRNVQRLRGLHGDPQAPRLASLEPQADGWFDPPSPLAGQAPDWAPTDGESIRQYLLATLESTLEMLEATADDSPSIDLYRLALAHEDGCGETLVRLAQTLDVGHPLLHALVEETPRRSPLDALWFPDTRWVLGLPEDGTFRFEAETGLQPVDVPSFEIDAQPVGWAAYAEFVEDGGYDEPRWWDEAGLAWLESTGRRTPRHVEQMRGGVLARRFGRTVREPLAAPAMHLTRHEAEAWCRWAGRRLPTEVEWELAAHQGASRGWQAGEVWEWTASRFRPYAGHRAGPCQARLGPLWGAHAAVRGASFATPARLRHPKLRAHAAPQRDDRFIGFRSCAV